MNTNSHNRRFKSLIVTAGLGMAMVLGAGPTATTAETVSGQISPIRTGIETVSVSQSRFEDLIEKLQKDTPL